jgi:hypothetical protein
VIQSERNELGEDHFPRAFSSVSKPDLPLHDG